MRVSTRDIADEIRALLDDERPHHRDELLRIARSHKGSAKHYKRALAALRDAGFYVDHKGEQWLHLHDFDDTSAATSRALRMRAIPELKRRIRAERGERVRAATQGADVQPFDQALAMHESTLASMALAAGVSPSDEIMQTLLDAETQARIIQEKVTTP